eukprot:Nitzschia sp. Nitz4//scaffold102_size76354//16773//18647//NITZ4_005628-RA/size76354-processed-gene-0.35-mRNA-1//-1//CDS//3329532237//6758//frame0
MKTKTKTNNRDNKKRKHNPKKETSKKDEPPSNEVSNKDNEEEVPTAVALTELSTDEKCDMIAQLSETILSDTMPSFKQEREHTDDNKSVRLPSKVQTLLDLARPHKNGGEEYVASLAVLSLLAVFKDILPSYRLRMPTDEERAAKISKETKQLWDYERALLTYYQQFLQLLEKSWDRGTAKGEAPSRLAVTSMLCLCELLKTAYHFNFRSNILQAVVRQMNNRSDPVSEACCNAVAHVFAKDTQGEVAMEAARLVSKLIKDYKGILRPEVLETFAKLPLRVHVDEAQAAKLAAAANAKKRKRDKELAEIESDLKEGSGTVDKILLARCQSETLQSVILTYFRILKDQNSATRATLLPVALEGLAKFAHLINIDTVVDLLDVLKQLLITVDELPLQASLNCILTAFQTLQGPGREMKIDVKEYVTPLYSQLSRLTTEENSQKNTSIVLECLTAAFIKRREYSTIRIAAFLKQIWTVSMHTPSFTSVPLLALSRQLLQRYPSTHQLLESESDVITSGQYTPDVEDPEFSNPNSTAAWELATLQFHVHPAIQSQAQGANNLTLLPMPAEAPDRLWKELWGDAQEMYIPCRVSQKRHPLAPKGTKPQLRFITPRKKEVTLLSIPEDDK